MNCPLCSEQMVRVEFLDTEAEICPDGCGISMQKGHYELLARDFFKQQRFFESYTVTKFPEKLKLRCPCCGNRLEKIAVGSNIPAFLDAFSCRDMYFIGCNEFDCLLKHRVFDSENMLIQLLQGIIKEKRVDF